MEAQIPPPNEKELPSPNEKLLRSPTFWKKLWVGQKKAAKWLAIGSIIFFLFLMLSILFLLSQKSTIVPIQPTKPPISTLPTITSISDPTANWQTYTNKKYGFEVKYPPYVKAGVAASNSVIGTVDNPVGGIYVGTLTFVVADSDILKKKSTDWINRFINPPTDMDSCKEGPCPNAPCFLETENIKNNSVNVSAVNCGQHAFYALIKGEKIDIFVDGWTGAANYKTLGTLNWTEDVNKILSTFKFLDQNIIK